MVTIDEELDACLPFCLPERQLAFIGVPQYCCLRLGSLSCLLQRHKKAQREQLLARKQAFQRRRRVPSQSPLSKEQEGRQVWSCEEGSRELGRPEGYLQVVCLKEHYSITASRTPFNTATRKPAAKSAARIGPKVVSKVALKGAGEARKKPRR